MVTKPALHHSPSMYRSVLAKIFMVTKQSHVSLSAQPCSVLAKIFMVTKLVECLHV